MKYTVAQGYVYVGEEKPRSLPLGEGLFLSLLPSVPRGVPLWAVLSSLMPFALRFMGLSEGALGKEGRDGFV